MPSSPPPSSAVAAAVAAVVGAASVLRPATCCWCSAARSTILRTSASLREEAEKTGTLSVASQARGRLRRDPPTGAFGRFVCELPCGSPARERSRGVSCVVNHITTTGAAVRVLTREWTRTPGAPGWRRAGGAQKRVRKGVVRRAERGVAVVKRRDLELGAEERVARERRRDGPVVVQLAPLEGVPPLGAAGAGSSAEGTVVATCGLCPPESGLMNPLALAGPESQLRTAQKVPHVVVAPIEDRVHAHERGPGRVGRDKRREGRAVRVGAARADDDGPDCGGGGLGVLWNGGGGAVVAPPTRARVIV